MLHALLLCTLVGFALSDENSDVDVEQTRIYGPGLRPEEIVLPARYFFIDAYDSAGNRLTEPARSDFKLSIEGDREHGHYCRVWVQTLNRYDGTYIVRYRTYQTCHKFTINVMYEGKHVAQSPYTYDKPVYPEDCDCPLHNGTVWRSYMGCPMMYEQIASDLRPFERVDMQQAVKDAVKQHHEPAAKSFCHYAIRSNIVYRKCYGKHVGFNMFVDNVLHSILRKTTVSDTEFLINLGDWPLIKKDKGTLIPMFSWCGSDETDDIILPTYEITEATLEMMGRVMVDILSVQGNNAMPWKDKKNKGFFRGRDSNMERLNLVSLGREHPDLLNVSLTNFFFFTDREKEYGPKEKHESFFRFFDYKYQIGIDGTVAAYRFPFLLAGSSVVFKQESSYYEYYYRHLVPFEHYIPFKKDLSDLIERIQWAIDNDDEAYKIGQNGRKFARSNLLPIDVFCYHSVLLEEWTKRLANEVKVGDGMEEVPMPKQDKRYGDCRCHRKNKHDEL